MMDIKKMSEDLGKDSMDFIIDKGTLDSIFVIKKELLFYKS